MGYNSRPYRPSYKKRRRIRTRRFVVFLLILAGIAVAVVMGVLYFTKSGPFQQAAPEAPAPTPVPYTAPEAPADTRLSAGPDAADTPHAVDSTQPSGFGFQTDIQVNGETVSSYTRPQPIDFGTGADYTSLTGVTTFRGNNFRDTGAFGIASVAEEELAKRWDINIGSLSKWTGAGYTCQPLIVQWDADMRQMMNLKPEKKSQDNLVEVIYPTMDGKIYFLDLLDGSYTRDPIDMGFTVKGTATLDPRGYPLLYIGQGIGMSGGENWDDTYMHIYSLIDGSELWREGAAMQDSFSYRPSWQAYDSSPLVAADADTLVWPGENGVIYTIVLNSQFDRAAGTVSVTPETPVKYRYTTPLNVDDEITHAREAAYENGEAVDPNGPNRWYGVEGSASAWKNYLFFCDNGGWLQCLDLNTMQLVYAQDVTDDTDCSPVLSQEGDGMYLYIGCEVDKQVPPGGEAGTAVLRKINAMTGEIVWDTSYNCYYVNKVDGGVLATPIVGENELAGLVFYTVARVDNRDTGRLVALDSATGAVAWETEMKHYGWSSPSAVYTQEGKGYLVQCDSGGGMTLYDGRTGAALSSVSLGDNIEASPAVFGNTVVVGTRGEKIFGVQIS